jgi:DNA-binding transcriptional MocR family regulator
LVADFLLTNPEPTLTQQRARLRRQRDHLHHEMTKALPEWHATRPPGGMSLWYQLPHESSTTLCATARHHGLLLVPGPHFYPAGGGHRRLRLPFSADERTLTDAVRRLQQAADEIHTRNRSTAHSPAPAIAV